MWRKRVSGLCDPFECGELILLSRFVRTRVTSLAIRSRCRYDWMGFVVIMIYTALDSREWVAAASRQPIRAQAVPSVHVDSHPHRLSRPIPFPPLSARRIHLYITTNPQLYRASHLGAFIYETNGHLGLRLATHPEFDD